MSMQPFPSIAVARRAYGRAKRTDVTDAGGTAVLDFGRPVKGTAWVVHHVFVRGAAGMTVRLIVGSDPGAAPAFNGQDEVDAVTANPAVNGPDEIYVDELEPIWALITGAGAAVNVFGSIRFRILVDEVLA